MTAGDRFNGWGTMGWVVTGGTYSGLTGATEPGGVVGAVVVLGWVDDEPGSVVVVDSDEGGRAVATLSPFEVLLTAAPTPPARRRMPMITPSVITNGPGLGFRPRRGGGGEGCHGGASDAQEPLLKGGNCSVIASDCSVGAGSVKPIQDARTEHVLVGGDVVPSE
jgi:hypothetical protein